MTAHTNKSKNGFSGFLRRLLGGRGGASASEEVQSCSHPSNKPSLDALAGTDSKFVPVPLRAVIAALPLELRGKVKKTAIGDVTIPILQAKVLAQLSTGAVCVSFGEIRSAAPAVFLGGGDADKVVVTLPLGEILPRLNPALLTRRPTQRQVQVSRNITSPFDDPTQALVFSMGGNQSVHQSPSQSQPALASQLRTADVIFKPISRAPAPMVASQPAVAAEPAGLPLPATTPAPIVVRMTHPPKNQPKNPPANAILVPLAALAENWPGPVREEIVEHGIAESRVALPAELIEISLKRARIVFQWKVVRSWIRPALAPYASEYDTLEVELPLRVVAPMFLQKRSAGERVQQRCDIDESIPNLFFGFPKPEAAPSDANDTNYYVWSDTDDRVQVNEPTFKKKSPSGTEFIAKYATPNEIVSRAAALDGVAGAVIALPDGLMVASNIPPDQNGETLAAFLPQIFARVSQSTKELHMGDLNNLSFTVGNVPWKIFRVNAIFFAAFGREGESLSTPKLAGLAAELNRKQK